jgi:RNA polymerase sigma-70 factor, ECF subfamily
MEGGRDSDSEESRNDERLLVEAARSDPGRFVDLYERHFDRVYAFAARRVATRADAEDVTADVFQRALAFLPRFQWRGAPFAAWLYRIAANVIADRFRKTGRERPLEDLDEAGRPERSEEEAIEARVELFGLVDNLPADQRRVVVLRFAEQWSVREIATELQRSEGAVKQLQFRALKTLRERLGGTHD